MLDEKEQIYQGWPIQIANNVSVDRNMVRNYFAGIALGEAIHDQRWEGENDFDSMSEYAFNFADAMLAEAEKRVAK